jgi:DNA-binding LacI/PurR family transcriptional regulator
LISIKDIARQAGVSHSTVSRALRNSPLVNAKTTKLIHRIAQEKGYVASAVARSLVNRRTDTIGVVVTTIADPFAGEVVGGIEEAALARGYSVILSASHSDPARELHAVHSFQERRVDGVLVMASSIGAQYGPMLRGMDAPIVLINSHHAGEFDYSIRIDDFAGGREAVAHLTELGHRRIAYIGDRLGLESDARRLAGYRSQLEDAGIRYNPGLVLYADGDPAGGLEAMSRLLRGKTTPTAVFCYNDRQALGAMRAAREGGLQIPRDISIVGFDDLFLSSYADPPLTTVRQPKHDMGCQAVKMLLDIMGGGRPAGLTTTGTLIVRESTARPVDYAR